MCLEGLTWPCRVTAIADKLGVEFALIHKQRDGKSEDAPERMELLVGDVRDKVRLFISQAFRLAYRAGVNRLLFWWTT